MNFSVAVKIILIANGLKENYKIRINNIPDFVRVILIK